MDKKITIGIVAVVALVGVGALYMYANKPASMPTDTTQTTQTQTPADQQTNNPSQKNLAIVSSESHATYEINEELRGSPNHVTGTTSAVSGTLTLDTNTPNKLTIDQIKIDASTFKTDNSMRDGNVKSLILKSDQPANKFITFTPTKVTGVPATIEVGKEFPIEITGNIFISGTTKETTFKGHATWAADNSLTIHGEDTLTYADFGLEIPNFSFLANVDKSVKLTAHLVAR